MRGLEEGKVTPARNIEKIAKEAFGIGAALRRFKTNKVMLGDHPPILSMANAILGAGIGQIVLPILSAQLLSDSHPGRMLNEVPNLEKAKFFGIVLTALALDLGMDTVAVIMAVNGNIKAALATKFAHNTATPIIADKIRPHLSTIVFQKSK